MKEETHKKRKGKRKKNMIEMLEMDRKDSCEHVLGQTTM